MRLLVITQDEPLYAPRYLALLLSRLGSDHRVAGVTALSPAGGRGWGALIRQRLAMYGPVDFGRAGVRFVAAAATGRLPGAPGRRHSVRRLARHHGIPLLDTADVNEPAYVETVRGLEIDVVVSLAANQRFGPELLAAPRRVGLNVHSSLLPSYRGLDGLFWALAHGERRVGVTVHELAAELDAGAIVAQEPIPVPGAATLHDLYGRAMDVGSRLLATAIDRYAAGEVPRADRVAAAPASYFSWPTAAATRRFRAHGHRFFSLL